MDIKLKNEEFIKLKNSIARKSVIKILLYSLGAIILFSVLIDGVYNDELADSLASVNRDIYYWCIANKIILLGITYLVIFAIISFLVIRNTTKIQKLFFIMEIYEIYINLWNLNISTWKKNIRSI